MPPGILEVDDQTLPLSHLVLYQRSHKARRGHHRMKPRTRGSRPSSDCSRTYPKKMTFNMYFAPCDVPGHDKVVKVKGVKFVSDAIRRCFLFNWGHATLRTKFITVCTPKEIAQFLSASRYASKTTIGKILPLVRRVAVVEELDPQGRSWPCRHFFTLDLLTGEEDVECPCGGIRGSHIRCV